MQLLSWFLGLFQKVPNTGLLLDDPERLEALPKHELFAGGAGTIPDWIKYTLPFRYQGSSMWCTAFAGCTIASIFEKQERGTTVFSPLELFYRSGGQLNGNYLINTTNAMQQSIVLESDVHTPVPASWGLTVFNEYKDESKATPDQINFGKQFAIKTAALVQTDKASLQQALISSPLMISIGIGKNYWVDPAPRQASYSAFHALVLLGIDIDGSYIVFDSLEPNSSFKGVHRLASDYEILSALSFIDLPDDWVTIQNQQTQINYYDALSHYGRTRNLAAEQLSAIQLTDACKKNPTIASLMGSQFTVAINAVTYGGYSVQDLLNSYTSIRRTGKPIFNLNMLRSAQV